MEGATDASHVCLIDDLMQELGECHMNITFERPIRKLQRAILKRLYVDYEPRRHDGFVLRYQTEVSAARLEMYHRSRGFPATA